MSTIDPIKCKQLTALVPGYLDGELSEEQAAPLRRHLLSCPGCRRGAADLTNLKRWTRAAVPSGELGIPDGFAARVAQAAFGGEHLTKAPEVANAGSVASAAPGTPKSKDSDVLSFVLGLTTVAAALLISLSFLIGMQGQPQGNDLSAQPMPDMLPEVLRDLDELNAKEKQLEKALGERGIEKERGRVKR